DPPPSSTLQRHCAQVPPPPHADDRKIPASASVCSSFPPAGTVMALLGSPLISIFTLPVLTRRERAKIISTTSSITITVNITTPATIVEISIITETFSRH